MIKIFDND